MGKEQGEEVTEDKPTETLSAAEWLLIAMCVAVAVALAETLRVVQRKRPPRE